MAETKGPGRKGRDDIIRREILRRHDTGEPISYRAILGAVGGSPATIKRVMETINLEADARGDAQREHELRERLRQAGTKVQEAEAYVRGAQEAGAALAREITNTLSTVKDAHGMLIREVDTLRGLMAEVRHELAANRPASDPLMEARLKKANAENGRLAELLEQMKRRLNDAGVETF